MPFIHPDVVRLRILHTNDIHSHFEQMPRVASLIRALRQEAGRERTLTLDIGDHLDRMRPETEGTDGAANVSVLRETGYDAVTIGNNEGLTYTPEVLDMLYGQADLGFSVVLANMTEASTGRCPSWAVPALITEKAGLRIGLIGVTARFSDFYKLLGWEVHDPIETVRRVAAELRDRTDLIIVLSHLGLKNDEIMAREAPGVDLILGGHSHHLLEEPRQMGQTWLCAAGKYGQYVGAADLEFDRGAGRLIGVGGGVHPTDAAEADDKVASLIGGYAAQAKAALGREVAHLSRGLGADWYAESPLGNLLAAGLRSWTGAEIGLVNAGQLLHGLSAGSVTAGQLLELCPSPINPCRMNLTGAQIRQALEESLLPEFMEKPIYGFGFRGKVLGTLCVDGLRVEYDPGGEPYAKITGLWAGDRPLLPDKVYTVGTIDMFTFGIGYLTIKEGTDVAYMLPEFIRDVILRELRDESALVLSLQRRWNVPKMENNMQDLT